jgi:LysM repeat protein
LGVGGRPAPYDFLMVPTGGAGSPVGTPVRATRDDPSAVAPLDVCPYLVDAAGAWRRAQPSRSHRCGARTPAPTIPALTQKRICLTAEHASCEFYVAATRARAEALLADHVRPERLETSRFHVVTRPMPMATDGVARGATTTTGTTGAPRGPLQLVAIALAIVLLGGAAAVAAAVVFQPRAQDGIAVGPTPTATQPLGTQATPIARPPAASSSASPPSTPSTAPTPTASPLPSATPRPTPTPGTRPTRYRVKRGDTLNRIAARFDTTVRAIRELNELGDNEDIRVGQILRIPPS